MASAGMTVTLRAKDEITPVLRGIKREVWMLAHPRLVLALLSAGWGMAGFLAALLLTVLTKGA